jgi:histidine ammonia-lyase
MAFDFAAIALSEVANISERRLELLLNPHMSHLNAFLTKEEGVCSGYMAAQYLAASLVNECKLLANPASTDSIPGNVGVEDHVSMGMTSARKLAKITELVLTVAAVELLAACQAVDLRGVAPLGEHTQSLYNLLREEVPMLEEDRIVAHDVEKAVMVCRRYLS